MKRFLTSAMALLGAMLAACGGDGSTGSALTGGTLSQRATAAAPSYEVAAMNLDPSDASPPSTAALGSGMTAATMPSDGMTSVCEPHLFMRTYDVVGRWNRHVWKPLRHVQELIARAPSTAGTTVTWESVRDGVDRKLSITEDPDGKTYTYELDLAAVPASGTPTFSKVSWGTVVRTISPSSVVTTQATLTFDFTALHSVIPAEEATGQLAAEVTMVKDPSKPAPGSKKTMHLTLTDFVPEEGDPAGPRSGTWTHVTEPGVGGALSFQDDLVLGCPANPTAKLARLTTVSRWYKATDGGVHGRADAKASGGQIPAGDTFMGVSCYLGVRGERPTAAREASAYWMMKLEDASGATLYSDEASRTIGGVQPCDPLFGAVPSPSNAGSDFDFGAAVSFPNAW